MKAGTVVSYSRDCTGGGSKICFVDYRWRRSVPARERLAAQRSRFSKARNSACWAIVAIKTPGTAKSRLAGAMSAEDRQDLVTTMLAKVIHTVSKTLGVHRILLVSPDSALQFPGVQCIADQGYGLNGALDLGRRYALARGARAILALPADLPFLRVSDLRALLRAGSAGGMTIATDRHGSGTNALYLEPPDLIPFAFGTASFARHKRMAARRGVRMRTVRRRGLLWDIDTITDLRSYNSGSSREQLSTSPPIDNKGRRAASARKPAT